MRTRLTWILAVLALVSIGVLIACGTKYSSSSNGLVVVPSQGGATLEGQGGPVMETFSLDLANGAVSEINNVNGPPTPGLPTSVVLDPAGAFAYVIVYQNPIVPGGGGVTGIATFQVASDGKLASIGTTPMTNPVALTMDSKGKFLFVANGSEGTVSVFSVGSNASLTEIPNSPFPVQAPQGGQSPTASALAVTPTVYPQLYAYCSGFTPPPTEDLYVTDSVNYLVLNYKVDPSAGTLTLRPVSITVPGVATGPVPSGVAVDPCNRFVYVANAGSGNNANSVSAFTMCSKVSLPTCPNPDFSLLPINHSPFAISPGDGPGPMAVDAYGNFLYVVDNALGEGQISSFRISPATGSLTPLTPPNVAAGSGANSIAIRSDDSWVFVANTNAATLSQYAIIQATGSLTPLPAVSTFNYPSGVAVK
jgi:6-phosphogluconolactonase (cycloisomerase 2 family)